MKPLQTPIFALVCDPDKEARRRLVGVLSRNQFVESTIESDSIKQTIDHLGKNMINAIFIDPLSLGLDAASNFIFNVRDKIPHIVFCLHVERSEIERQATRFYDGSRERFHHYYTLDKEADEKVFRKDSTNVVFLCASDIRVFSEMERLKKQRSFYLDALPPEDLTQSLRKFRQHFLAKWPERKIAFIMMGFEKGKVHKEIQLRLDEALAQFKIIGVRADKYDFNSNLLRNVQTYLHGCDLGIAVFERVKGDSFSPNVAYEVGYLNALRKPICILKDNTIAALPCDLLGELYSIFDIQDLKRSIKSAIRDWMARQALGTDGPSPM